MSASRRQFVKTSAAALAGAAALPHVPFVRTAHAEPDDPIRVGVIGCGGRGTGAMLNVLQAGTDVVYPERGYHTETVSENAEAGVRGVSIVALADLFDDRLQHCREQLGRLGLHIPDEMCFVGWDAYEKLVAIPEINYVIHATPPHFRPMHLMAAIEAGKHVFIEKPAAVDGPGVQLVLKAGELAKQKGLGIVAGTQRRHDPAYVETIDRIRDGAIGEIHTGRAYWNGGVIWAVDREEGWSDMEWQVRNWNYFTWMSGDHIVEQHLHNLDVINWAMDAYPVRAHALGGRQARGNHPIYGHVYDHFAVEYEYENGARMFSQCRQIDGIPGRVEEAVEGSKGFSNCHQWIRRHDGGSWRFTGERVNPYDQEHIDLIRSIRTGEPINEAQHVAYSTLTGIMGRESAYSGLPVTWEEALNMPSLSPPRYEFGPMPFPEVAIPGKYRLL